MSQDRDVTAKADEIFAALKASERGAEQAERRLAKAEHAERMGRPRTYRSDRLGRVTIPED